MNNTFMGKNGFYWFFGTVEDNGDPLGLGRCRVRISGWHNPDRNILNTNALPWAYPITPLTNSAIAGIGQSPIGPLTGTRVFGFFMDGESGQQPCMIGTIPGGTEKEFKEKLEYGSSPWQPIVDKLLNPFSTHEGDCPTGYDIDTVATNEIIPDQRDIEVNVSEWGLPCTGFVSSAYNEARGRGTHNGVDICPAGFFEQIAAGAPHLNNKLRGPVGQPIYSAAKGVVSYIWTSDRGQGGVKTTYDKDGKPESRSFGNALAITHTLSTGTYISIYAHLGTNQNPAEDIGGSGIDVVIGQEVLKGQQIGTMGRTHVYDALTHLHFEIRKGRSLPRANNHINPGRIFPQLANKHTAFLSYANSTASYKTADLPFNKDNAPVKAKEGPT